MELSSFIFSINTSLIFIEKETPKLIKLQSKKDGFQNNLEKLDKKTVKFNSKKTNLLLSNMQLTIDTSNKSLLSIDSFSINPILSSKRWLKEIKVMEFLKNEGIYQIAVNEVMGLKFFQKIASPKKLKIQSHLFVQNSNDAVN